MRKRAAAVSLFCAALAPTLARSQSIDPNNRAQARPRSEWRAGVGLNYSSGRYGETARTGVLSAPLSIKYARGPIALKASLSWLRIAGPADILEVPQGRSAITVDGTARAVAPSKDRRVGLGDARLSAIYSFDLGRDWYVDASARLKLPTASVAKGLGTGRVEAEIGADLVKEAGDASFYVGARRAFASIGSSAGGRDVWGAGAGASYWISNSVNAGVDYDRQQSSFAGEKPSSEATLWAGFRVAKRLRARVYVTRGFNDNSADFAGGLSLSWRLN